MPCNTPPPPTMDDEEDQMEVPEMEDDIIIIEDTDDAVNTFVFHSDPVFCCNFDKAGVLAVTGGQDDRAVVWDTNTDQQAKFVITEHRDSVIAADFNHDSSLVASADMDGLIQVWNVSSGSHEWDFETTEITWMAWHPTTNLLFAGTIDGNCWKWSVPDGATCEVFPTHGVASSCGRLLDNGSKCVVGYQDGSVKLWDVTNSSLIGSLHDHKQGVLCLASSPDGTLIASGAEDGTVKLIRSSNFKVLHSWNVAEDTGIESIGFFRSHPLIAVGTSQGDLNIYDLSTYTLRASTNLGDSIVKLVCSDSSPFVYIACGSNVECYDGRSCEVLNKWFCHDDRILDLAFSPRITNFGPNVTEELLCALAWYTLHPLMCEFGRGLPDHVSSDHGSNLGNLSPNRTDLTSELC
ncbi:Angio-associated migratory cell protein [Araneus ventricosus]|uniref:Angio-associated migratory cell protein n=1 Tax=Araneus ventricosus TaxID=182803 RepID=A0A4Y2C0B7_ARAVE|nr:Angio-associated migratory cell protein [Araneus ventricosus]